MRNMNVKGNQMAADRLRAVGDGFADATAALQEALDMGGEVVIPSGRYRVTATLRVPSHTHITAHPLARVYLCGDTPKAAHDYLLTNSDHAGGNEDITITGGVWDGNNQGRENHKGNITDLTAYSGTLMNFFNVRGLTLRDFVAANPAAYYIRMAKIENFTIEDIRFLSDTANSNQDGLHFGGECRNGVVRRISALSKGQTGDDLIALNADDCLERVENVGMICGDIENILFEDLFAEECHTILRLLSVTHAIRGITVRGVLAGFRMYAVNMDGARYCRMPLFHEEDFPKGVGHIENVAIENMTCCTSGNQPAVAMESNAFGLTFRGFRFIRPAAHSAPALFARNLFAMRVSADGKAYNLSGKADTLTLDFFSELMAEPANAEN